MRTFLLLFGALAMTAGCTDYELNAGNDGTQTDDDDPGRPDDGDEDDDDDPPDDDPGDDTGDGPPDFGDDGAVTGLICDPSTTAWVAGALVYISIDWDGDGVEDERISTLTAADGSFTLVGVPEGIWTVVIEKGSFTASYEVVVFEGEITEIPEPVCLEAQDVKIAVITGEYDDIGSILTSMGMSFDNFEGYTVDDYVALLTDLTTLQTYDMVFFNCDINTSWYNDYATIRDNLETYIHDAGRVYVSDWSYYFIELPVPDAIDFYGTDTTFGTALDGSPGDLTADVLDPNMQAMVGGTTAELNFNLNSWALAEAAGTGSTVMVQADAGLYSGGTLTDAKLAIKVEYGAGRAIFTAFHNEAQATVDMGLLLREIVLTL